MKLNMPRAFQVSYLALVYLFFYIPIFILILYSFNVSKYSLVWHGFTMHWYQQLFHDNALWIAALHSFVLGILAATIASFVGTLAAVSLLRYRFFGRQLLHGLIFILILAPDIVLGTALLITFNRIKIPLGFWTLLLAHITFCIPFVVVTVYSRIISLDKTLFAAAKDLGASEFLILRKIIVPLLMPGIIAGWLLSFTLSLDDVIVSYFVAGSSFQILPLLIYALVRASIDPEINALCTILFVITLALVTMTQIMLRKKA